ncbi:MAG TPA: MarR family transcriptional regulator [Beijerinckiaceae bacterium]|nr:MarR family transcriptional regulator [Beijerinckiaceae bacterium]
MSRPQKPISDLDVHLGYWLRSLSNHVSQAFQRKVETHGVTVAEWVLLRVVLRLGSAAPSELADAIGMTRGAVSRLVERVAQKNLAKVARSPSDKRAQIISLTGRGRRLVPALARLADENDDEFFGRLPSDRRSELEQLIRALAAAHGLRGAPID